MSNVGHDERSYSKFKPFTLIEIIAFLRFINLNGLISSMRFKHKFKSQIEDPVAGDNSYSKIAKKNLNAVIFCRSKSCTTTKKVLSNCKHQDFLDYIQNISHEVDSG